MLFINEFLLALFNALRSPAQKIQAGKKRDNWDKQKYQGICLLNRDDFTYLINFWANNPAVVSFHLRVSMR